MSLLQEFFGLIRGAGAIAEAGFKLQEEAFSQILNNYGVKSLIKNATTATKDSNSIINQKSEDSIDNITAPGENLEIVVDAINQFISHSVAITFKSKELLLTDAGIIKPGLDHKSEFDQTLLKKVEQEIVLTPNDKDLLEKLDVQYMEKHKASSVAAAVNLHLITKTDNINPNQSNQEESNDADKFNDSKFSKTKKK